MSNITFCWELGGGYGHIAGFEPLAEKLIAKGYCVNALLRDTSNAHQFFKEMPVRCMNAPIGGQKKRYAAPTISYADIIKRCGYDSTESLLSLVQQWREKLHKYGSALIIADHAPTALIAARTLKLPATLFGTGFFSPPPLYPLPSITPWLNTPPDFLQHIEAEVLEVINDVLRHFAVDELDYLYQLFEVDENFLCTLPELDHYSQRNIEAYWGPRFSDTTGIEAFWPKNGKKNIFIYTNNKYDLLDSLLLSLKRIDANILIHCAGMDRSATEGYAEENICFSLEPVQIKSIEGKADLVICHAGHGTVAATLLMGIPLLLMPTQLEQLLLAGKLNQLKLSNTIDIRAKQTEFGKAVKHALGDQECEKRVKLFAEHYRGFDQQDQLEEIVLACGDLLRQ